MSRDRVEEARRVSEGCVVEARCLEIQRVLALHLLAPEVSEATRDFYATLADASGFLYP